MRQHSIQRSISGEAMRIGLVCHRPAQLKRMSLRMEFVHVAEGHVQELFVIAGVFPFNQHLGGEFDPNAARFHVVHAHLDGWCMAGVSPVEYRRIAMMGKAVLQ